MCSEPCQTAHYPGMSGSVLHLPLLFLADLYDNPVLKCGNSTAGRSVSFCMLIPKPQLCVLEPRQTLWTARSNACISNRVDGCVCRIDLGLEMEIIH
jgi:hypothetical protein